jgi:hypothetical protein
LASDNRWQKSGFWALGFMGVALVVVSGIRSDRDRSRQNAEQTAGTQGTANSLQHISQVVDHVQSKLDDLSRQPPSLSRQAQVHQVRRQLNAALNPSGNPLLEKSQNMRDSLCGLGQQWIDETTNRERMIEFSSMGHADNAARQRHFFMGQINAAYTKRYLQEYAHDADNLRIQLINQVPGVEEPGLDYLNPGEFKTDSGEPFITSNEMSEYCADLTKLVSAFQTKLLMQPHQ